MSSCAKSELFEEDIEPMLNGVIEVHAGGFYPPAFRDRCEPRFGLIVNCIRVGDEAAADLLRRDCPAECHQ